MKDLIGMLLLRIDDYFHERDIRALHREYDAELRKGRTVMAQAVLRDIHYAVECRSPEQWARMQRRQAAKLDPHARAVLQQESRA